MDEWLNDPRSLPPEAILQSSGNELANFRVTVIEDATPDKAVENNDVDVGVKIDGLNTRDSGGDVLCLSRQSRQPGSSTDSGRKVAVAANVGCGIRAPDSDSTVHVSC